MGSRPLRSAAALAACAACCAAASAVPAGAAARCPWLDAARPPAARAAQLLAAMSLRDKLALLSGVATSTSAGASDGTYAGYVPANPLLCIPALTFNDGGAGVGDGQVGTTAFPAPIAQAATWDPSLQRRLGLALGSEAWQKGIDVLLAPDVNIARVPQNGRNFEAFGEDPFLSGQTAAAEIAGIQESPVIATVKHFAVNSQETSRYYLSSNVDDRTLHEIYLPPFEAAVQQANVGAVMCAYGLVNGVPACEDPRLLTTVLRQGFGFGGIVMSDWNATGTTALAANAGVDLVMPTTANAGPLPNVLASGELTTATLNAMVRRVLFTMFRIGLFDRPPPPRQAVSLADVSSAADRAVALEAAEEGTVLLKDAVGTLPFQLRRGATIAVIGAPASGDVRHFISGGGSAFVAATRPVSPLAALRARAARAGVSVAYADGGDPAAAAALAGRSTVAVVFAYDVEREGQDRPNLELPAGQDELIAQVAKANRRTVVVLQAGGPVLMTWLGGVAAVLQSWYPGQADGAAVAPILFGDVNPSGKLPQTFPTEDALVPAADPVQWPGEGGGQDAAFSEGIAVGYRWYDEHHVIPLFPFGYGLSYTRFAYRRLRVRRAGGSVSVSFTVANVGRRAGAEVAQLYVDDPRPAGEPPRQLEGYRRVWLRPGRSTRVTLALTARSFAYWDGVSRGWLVAHGLYRILVGSSSRDIRLRGFVRQ